MAKGHKGKKAMVKERTRRLSRIEQIMVDEQMAIIKESGHLVIIDFEPTDKLVAWMELSEKITKEKIALKEIRLQSRHVQSTINKKLRFQLKEKQKREYEEKKKLKVAA